MAKRTSPASQQPLPSRKDCAICGRIMEYRPKWKNCWHSVKTCSAACRATKLTATDRALEQSILSLLQSRKVGASICPSEASRMVLGAAGLSSQAMQRTRYAANRLVAQGCITMTQKGVAVCCSTARGPIRLVLNKV